MVPINRPVLITEIYSILQLSRPCLVDVLLDLTSSSSISTSDVIALCLDNVLREALLFTTLLLLSCLSNIARLAIVSGATSLFAISGSVTSCDLT